MSIVFLIIALLCHEIALAYPFYLAAALFFGQKYNLRRAIIGCLPSLVVVVAYLLFRLEYASLKTNVIDHITWFHLTWLGYWASFTKLIFYSLINYLFAKDIVLIRVIETARGQEFGWIVVFIAAMIGVGAFFYSFKKDTRSLALSWFLVGLLPVSLACFSRPELGFIVEPHWLFFASQGFFLYLAIILESWRLKSRRAIWVAVVVCLISVNIYGSRLYNKLWANEIAYCQYLLQLSPRLPLVQFWLADAHRRENAFEKARFYYQQALRKTFDDWEIYFNLGAIEFFDGNPEAALKFFKQSQEINPHFALTYNNIAYIYLKQGNQKKAAENLQRALSLDPNCREARLNLERLALLAFQ